MDGPTGDEMKELEGRDFETAHEREKFLRDWTARAATVFREKADGFTGSTKVTLSKLGAELNKVSGYEEIENLKRRVVAQEALITTSRQAARQAKKSHDEAVLQRSNSQREVNDLLQRKSTWDDADVVRFTALVRQDHLFEQAEMQAKRTVEETDLAVDREFSELMRAILARYHEEQVWSDKIRSASTYGQMAVLGLNLLVFLTAIVVVEPWKRRRLAETFEQKITEMNQEYRQALEGAMGNVEKLLEARTPLPLTALRNAFRPLAPGYV
ncbi:Mdm33 family-domain-containing protein [Mycena floridula]|nr:Mdm33 family-domain-containing protein [Mycena floridula]